VTEARASRFECMHGLRTRSKTEVEVVRILRNFQSMLFGEMPPPSLGEDMKAHIGGFHLFKPEVMRARLPFKWQWSKMETYDESSNSEVHIKFYMTQTNLFFEDLWIHYHLFPTTFKRPCLGVVLLVACQLY